MCQAPFCVLRIEGGKSPLPFYVLRIGGGKSPLHILVDITVKSMIIR